MAKQDFIPPKDDAFLVWHDRFKTTVTANLAALGLVAGDATQVNTDNTDIHAKVAASNLADTTAKQATADKNASRKTVEAHARAMVRRIKAAPTYTVALGELCGIIGPENTTDLSTAKPLIAGLDKRGGHVEISFNLLTSEGVNIYSQRDGDTDFKLLSRDTHSPYVDNRPMLVAGKPELRQYRAIFVVGDQEVSQFSDDLTVNCAPLV
jgi:hypothetical protein